MPTRAYWSGNIRLSLVSIPIQVIPATKSGAKIAFHQIHKPSGARIRYQKIVPDIGPVDTDDIVKGYELEKGKYVLLEDKEIDKLKLEAKKTLELVQFVNVHEIDPMYFERPFFVLPDDEEDDEAFIVLRDALKKTKKIGLGQIVIRGKGTVVALKACGKGMLLETLRYADEVKEADRAFSDIKGEKPAEDMIDLAEELIKKKTKKFDPEAFKDKYEEALRELIEAKAEHREIRQVEETRPTAKVIDLMDALRKSVGKNEGREKKSSKRSKKHSRRKAA
ncbi:MAG TPA: Ku protein [Xanthobacteraceae bacterium]|nr:Ku protein [Xanthobacteraceae bacterium]